jgi:hypothetical protein
MKWKHFGIIVLSDSRLHPQNRKAITAETLRSPRKTQRKNISLARTLAKISRICMSAVQRKELSVRSGGSRINSEKFTLLTLPFILKGTFIYFSKNQDGGEEEQGAESLNPLIRSPANTGRIQVNTVANGGNPHSSIHQRLVVRDPDTVHGSAAFFCSLFTDNCSLLLTKCNNRIP